ncbi:hypothetical protein P0082_03715 [Candidatus Haliotispira prima]|uniref:Uncharacterized protein n=1 Tax=Candidatus Haliotispira prima TaxID=3034016 RepID=A0ABY8MJA9_9SPIO|nr:hypothetical protein P0082_03715 [Candidatus Haliotispira prima]
MSDTALRAEGSGSEAPTPTQYQYETFEENFYRVYHKEFAALLRTEVTDLCGMCNQLMITHEEEPEEVSLNSGGVYRFVMECTRCEDLLDQVHADRQQDWAYIRKLVAVIKHSCSITATLQYPAVLAEKLTDSVEGNFAMANQFVLRQFYRILLESAKNFLRETLRLDVMAEEYELSLNFPKYFTPDIRSLIRLQAGNSFQPAAPDAKQTRETILYLVSALLDHCNVIEYLGSLQNVKTSKRKEIIANDLHEESLASQCEMFHSIITIFDTQCSQKQIVAEPEVLELINHVKVIYHLFTGFSALMRIQERHYSFFIDHNIQFPLNDDEIHGLIFDFFIIYIDRFRLQVEKISKRLIQKHSVQKKINLPIPGYRGFHVRPSTLVARIVMHYGSNVNMLLKDTVYNTAIPLDLFRANEVINAEKRREIGEIIANNKECQEYCKKLRKSSDQTPVLIQKYFLELFQSLQKQEKIVVYKVLSEDSLDSPSLGEEFFEYAKREVAYLMATGNIDIASDLTVVFEGDSRVLADITVLAESGYGEDKAGNNVPLPKELSYLRR